MDYENKKTIQKSISVTVNKMMSTRSAFNQRPDNYLSFLKKIMTVFGRLLLRGSFTKKTYTAEKAVEECKILGATSSQL